jgi:hypothetical protein
LICGGGCVRLKFDLYLLSNEVQILPNTAPTTKPDYSHSVMPPLSSSSQSTVILLTTLAIVSAVTIFSTAHLVRRRHSNNNGGKEEDDALRDLVLDEERYEEDEKEEELTRPVLNAVKLKEKKKTQVSPLPQTATSSSPPPTSTSTPVLSPVRPHEVRLKGAATTHTADVLLNKDIQTTSKRYSGRRSVMSKKEQDSAGPTPSKKVTKVSSKDVTVRSNTTTTTKGGPALARERRESHHHEEEDSSGATRTTVNEEDEDTTEDSSVSATRDEGTASDLSASGDDDHDESYFYNNLSQKQQQQRQQQRPETRTTQRPVSSSDTIRVAQLPIELELQYQNKNARSYIERAKYSGPLVNGQPHGMGVLWFENGSMYVGEFHMSEMHGVGAFNYKRKGKNRTSHVYRGEFVHNEFVPEPTVHRTTTENDKDDNNDDERIAAAQEVSPSSSSSVDQDGPVHRVRVRETLKHTIEAYLCVTQAKKEQRRSGKGSRHEIRR